MNKNKTIYLLFLGFLSVLYDIFVIRRMDKNRHMEQWTWFTVVIGVAYTLGVVWMYDRKAAMTVFVAFCFSGAPMAIGDLIRYFERERNGNKAIASATGVDDFLWSIAGDSTKRQ